MEKKFLKISKNEMLGELNTYSLLNRLNLSLLSKFMFGYSIGNNFFLILEYGEIYPIGEKRVIPK